MTMVATGGEQEIWWRWGACRRSRVGIEAVCVPEKRASWKALYSEWKYLVAESKDGDFIAIMERIRRNVTPNSTLYMHIHIHRRKRTESWKISRAVILRCNAIKLDTGIWIKWRLNLVFFPEGQRPTLNYPKSQLWSFSLASLPTEILTWCLNCQ